MNLAWIGGLVLAIGMGVLSVVVKRAADAIGRGVERCSEVLQAGFSATSNGPGTDPQLLERLEAVERRVSLALDDLSKQYRKVVQERKRLGVELGEEPEDPEQLELAEQLRRARSPESPAPSPDGRPRLRSLRHR